MDYSTNKKTNEVINGKLGINFRRGDWRQSTQEEIDNYNLKEKKRELHKIRKFIRDKEKYSSTIECLGSTFKSDTETLQALLLARGQMNGEITSIDWFDYFDNAKTLTIEDVKTIIAAVYNRGLQATIKSKTIKAEIESITNLSELESYDVNAKWDVL